MSLVSVCTVWLNGIVSVAMNLLPADWITVAYLVFTSGLIFVRRKNLTQWHLYLLCHIFLILAILLLSVRSQTSSPLVEFVRSWYPISTIPIFYLAVAPLTQLVYRGYFDEKILRLENRLFSGQPSIHLSQLLSGRMLSEVLHFCYLSYYGILVSLPAVLYLNDRHEAFREVVFAEVFTFYVCLVWYIFMPVTGPRYRYRKLEGHLTRGLFHRLAHSILLLGSAKGTAFPSSHAAVTVAIVICAIRYDLLTFLVLLPFCVGLLIGTVYGRFHYAVDTIVGSGVAVLSVWIATMLYRFLL